MLRSKFSRGIEKNFKDWCPEIKFSQEWILKCAFFFESDPKNLDLTQISVGKSGLRSKFGPQKVAGPRYVMHREPPPPLVPGINKFRINFCSNSIKLGVLVRLFRFHFTLVLVTFERIFFFFFFFLRMWRKKWD